MGDGTLQVSVVTPEGAAFDGAAISVVAPAFDGEVAFFKGHAPFVGMLGEGELRVQPASGQPAERYFLTGGVVQVRDDVVTILAEAVADTDSIDVDEATKSLAAIQAEEASGDEAMDRREARARVERARIRVGSSATN